MFKLLSLLIFTLSFSSSAQILSPGPVIGFSDSSFNYSSQEEATDASFCFFGDFETACNEIENSIAKIRSNYYQGSHDTIDLVKCDLVYGDSHTESDTVNVSYVMHDDYGSNYSVNRVLNRCVERSSL